MLFAGEERQPFAVDGLVVEVVGYDPVSGAISLFFSGKQGNGTGGGFVPDCLDHQAVRHEWLPFPSCEERCVPRQLALWEAGLLRLLRRFCRGICASFAPPVRRGFARFPDGRSYPPIQTGLNRA